MKQAAIELLEHFDATAELYQQYLKEDQKYSIAKGLKKHNEQIIDTLSAISTEFETAPQLWSKALVAHLQAWHDCWTKLDATKLFQNHEPFVFENDHRYPREQAQQLEKYLRKLAK